MLLHNLDLCILKDRVLVGNWHLSNSPVVVFHCTITVLDYEVEIVFEEGQ